MPSDEQGHVRALLLAALVPGEGTNLLALFTRKERLVTAGVLLGIVIALGLLLFPLATQGDVDPNPEAPQQINDTSGDGLSDVVNVYVYGSNPEVNDTSGDGIQDAWKAEHAKWNETFRTWRPHPALNDSHRDLDGDGLTLLGEYHNDTDPWDKDTSDDGFPDGWLVRSGLNPTEQHDPEHVCAPDGMTIGEKFEYYEAPGRELLACAEDSSGNGLPDKAAIEGEWTVDGRTVQFSSLDPRAFSTGGSGVPDGWLIYHGLDPHSHDHRYEDIEDNGLSTLEAWEWMKKKDLTSVDDWSQGLDPAAFSSAGHGIPDGWLIEHDLDPLDPTLAEDHLTDSGLTVREEYEHGTDPHKADTSGDGLKDGECVEGWTVKIDGEEKHVRCNPLVQDSSGDGLPDKAQKEGQIELEGRVIEFPPTNPMSTDTDGDGLSDLEEIDTGGPGDPPLDPSQSDTSGSGLLDGEEWDLFQEAVERARTDSRYASIVASEQGVDASQVPDLLGPYGDLSGDGVPNVLAADATDDGLTDGEQVHPPTRNGRQLPTSDPTLVDSAGNGLPDAWELEYTRYDAELGGWLLDPMLVDSKGNGVSDAEEDYATGCFDNPDLEGNGIPWEDKLFPNRLEMQHNTHPFECDTIGDGLPDGWTVYMNERIQEAGIDLTLSPTTADSMGDGVTDGDRVSPVPDHGEGRVNMVDQDPACPEPTGKTVCLWRWGTQAEPLSDRFADRADMVDLKGDCGPRERCTVVLELTLADEVRLRTDPSAGDTSGDGFQDAWKVLHRFDPTASDVPEPNGDPDGDGLPTWEEYVYGSDPLDMDTDKGGVPDGPDRDPLNPAMDDGDCDWDGILDREEATSAATGPGTSDTSGDGLLDASFDPRSCETAGGSLLIPEVGVDIVAVPGEDDQGSFTLVGSDDTGTDASTWDTSGDRLPDGWKVHYDLNPLNQHSPQLDLTGDGMSLMEAYQLGRPSWWSEDAYGAWWFGADPTTDSKRDMDGDGLDDTLFDPEPLSPANDCQLPEHWELPPAWQERGEAFCMATEPLEDDRATFLEGVRQLAYEHVLNTTASPIEERQEQDATQPETIRATSITIEDTLHTSHALNATVDLCLVDGDDCTTPSSLQPPPVGVYASYDSAGDAPDPRDDVLLCILTEATGWTLQGTCHLAPGTREAPSEDAGLLLAPHAHGFVQPGEAWTVNPGDIVPGRQVEVTAWPLPTERDAVLAPEVQPQETPPPATQEPVDAQALIEIPEDLVFDRGEPQEITFQLTDAVGHPLPDHRVDVTWDGEDLGTQRTGEDGRLPLDLDPGVPDEPTTLILELEAASVSGIQGIDRTLEVPVRMPTTLDIHGDIAPAGEGLQVQAGLLDHRGQPVPEETITASLVASGSTAEDEATTGPDGNATLTVATPPDAQPGQAPLVVRYPGSDAWAPSEWTGRADVIVAPNVTLQAPAKIDATEGASIEAGLFLPSGEPLVPAPGDPVTLVADVAGERVERTVANPLSGGTTEIPIPGGAGMSLGHQSARIEVASDTFVSRGFEEDDVQVTSPSQVRISPERLGAGVENPLEVTVTDVWERGVEGAPVEVTLGDSSGKGTSGPEGVASTVLDLPLDTERGGREVSVRVGATNASEPLDVDVPVTVVMGTVLHAPEGALGSVDEVDLQGALETARGEPMPHQAVLVDAFDREQEVQTDSEGSFEVTLLPPEDTEPGTYPATLRFKGTDELAATSTTTNLTLTVPTRFDVPDPDPAAVDAPLGLEGRVITQSGEPATGGTVIASLDDRTDNATVASDGSFQAELDTEGMTPGEYTVRFTYRPAEGYAPAETSVPVELRQDVQLTVQQRTTEDGVHLSIQATREDGAPLEDARLAVMTPGNPLMVETDDEGVARVDLKHGVLEPGSELDIRYSGDEHHAATQTSVEVASPPLIPPGEGVLITGFLVALLAIEGVILWRVLQRRRIVEDVLEAVEQAEHRLRAGDEVSAAILSSYHRLRKGVEAAGWTEEEHQTHREFLVDVFKDTSIPTSHLEPFVELVDRAQYDSRPIPPDERSRALRLASNLAGDLRDALGRGAAS